MMLLWKKNGPMLFLLLLAAASSSFVDGQRSRRINDKIRSGFFEDSAEAKAVTVPDLATTASVSLIVLPGNPDNRKESEKKKKVAKDNRWQFLSGSQSQNSLELENETTMKASTTHQMIAVTSPLPPLTPPPRSNLVQDYKRIDDESDIIDQQRRRLMLLQGTIGNDIVGFSLVRAKRASLEGVKGRVEFENVFTDLNGAWDSHRAVFRCKRPGLYFFSFNARGQANAEGKFWLVSLMLNGVEVVSIGGRDESGSSNSILLALNLYDEVWLQLMQGRLVESRDRSNAGLTSFSGYRIGGIEAGDIEDRRRRPSNNGDDDDDGDRFFRENPRDRDHLVRRKYEHRQRERDRNRHGEDNRRSQNERDKWRNKASSDRDHDFFHNRRGRPDQHQHRPTRPYRHYQYYPEAARGKESDRYKEAEAYPFTSLRLSSNTNRRKDHITDNTWWDQMERRKWKTR